MRPLIITVVGCLAGAGCSTEIAPPTATAALVTEGTIYPGTVVQLDASASSDANKPRLALTYRWEFLAIPPASRVTFNDSALTKPSFIPDRVGTYELALEVSNGIRIATAEPLVITVDACWDPILAVSGLTARPSAVHPGQSVGLSATLEGDTFCDSSHHILYAWSFAQLPSGSGAALNSPNLENPSFVSDVQGQYRIQLVVSDTAGRSSIPAHLDVAVNACGKAPPAITGIQTSPSPRTGATMELSATVSDADTAAPCNQDPELLYHWQLSQTPPGASAQLSSSLADKPWLVPDVAGAYEVRLVVEDITGLKSAPRSYTFTVGSCGSDTPAVSLITANPATPGIDLPVLLSATVVDDDNSSTICPPSGLAQRFSYRWRIAQLPSGSHATLNDPSLEEPSLVPDLSGAYSLELVVTDDTGRASDPKAFTLNVSDCGSRAPQVTLITTTPTNPDVESPVLVGSTVVDDDNNATFCPPAGRSQLLAYQWRVAELPAGSTATLNDSTLREPSFVPDKSGDYTLELTVTDDTGRASDPTPFTVTVTNCGGHFPAVTGITATPPDPNVDVEARLAANVGDADNDTCVPAAGQLFAYQWRVTSAPHGATFELGDPTVPSPTIRAGTSGTYTIELVVTDDTGRASAPYSFDLVVGDCGEHAPAVTALTPAPDPLHTLAWGAITSDAEDYDIASCTPAVPQTLSFEWSILSQPLGADANFDNPSAAAPGFFATQPGDYDIELVVTDSTGRSARLVETVTVGDCGSRAPDAMIEVVAPVAVAAQPAVTGLDPVRPGTAVVLRGDSSTDLDNTEPLCPRDDPLSYEWRLVSVPPGSQAAFANRFNAEATFFTAEPGLYQAELWVSDGVHLSNAATFEIQADLTLTIGVPLGGTDPVAYIAGGVGLGFDGPTGVVAVGTTLYVTQEGNDSVVEISDYATIPTVRTLTSGVFLNGPRRIAYAAIALDEYLYVLNGHDDFVIRIQLPSGAQEIFIDGTVAAEDIDTYLLGGGTPHLAVVGQFIPRIDSYLLDADPLTGPAASEDFAGHLDEPFACEASYNAANQFWAPTRELSGFHLRHVYGGLDDIRPIDDQYEAGSINDLSLFDNGAGTAFLYYAVGGAEYVARIDDCATNGCGALSRQLVATSFAEIGGIHAEDLTHLVVADKGANAVYRITLPTP